MCEDCPSTAPCSCWEEWRSRFLWEWDGGHSSGVSPGLGLGSGPTMPHSRVWAWRPLYHLSPQTSPGRYLWPSDLAPHPGRCSSHTHPPASPWAPGRALCKDDAQQSSTRGKTPTTSSAPQIGHRGASVQTSRQGRNAATQGLTREERSLVPGTRLPLLPATTGV